MRVTIYWRVAIAKNVYVNSRCDLYNHIQKAQSITSRFGAKRLAHTHSRIGEELIEYRRRNVRVFTYRKHSVPINTCSL